MKKLKYISTAFLAAAVLVNSSCKKYLEINTDPNNIVGVPANAPIPQIMSSSTVQIGFMGGSVESIIQSIIVQQYSGQSTGALNQTQDFDKYNLSPSDQNTPWGSYYNTTINNLETVISKAGSTGSPHYKGVAEILRAYTYQCMVDIWGKIPYTTANKLTDNLTPKLDDDAAIYTDLLKQIDQGIVDINAANPSSASLDPNLSSTIYQTSSWAASKAQWQKFANTLKLRMYLHYSKKDPAFAATQINALVNSGVTFMASNSDSFQMLFTSTAGDRNPIYNFELSRANYLVANNFLVSMMQAKNDPRIPFYFLPVGKTTAYKGAVGGAPAGAAIYSHIGTYLTGTAGEAPIRMLTYAEYNFIRAEAALNYATPGGTAQSFFQAGITASMLDAGVSVANIATYIAANGTLSTNPATALQQIINEKYTANIEVVCEPWTDWRRTGYPTISPTTNPLSLLTYIPRSFYYPQSETDSNPNIVQKADMSQRVFWDIP